MIQRTGDVDGCKILVTLVLRAIPTVRVSHLSSCAYFNVSERSKQCCDLLGVGMLTTRLPFLQCVGLEITITLSVGE